LLLVGLRRGGGLYLFGGVEIDIYTLAFFYLSDGSGRALTARKELYGPVFRAEDERLKNSPIDNRGLPLSPIIGGGINFDRG